MKKFHENAKLVILSTLAAVTLLSLTGVAFASSSLDSSTQWAVYGETTQPNGNLDFHPIAHGMTFSMPDATASSPAFVNYMLDTYTVSLSEASTITATISVTTSSATTDFYGNPNGYKPSYSDVRLFIEANLPNDHSASCTGGAYNVENYWWANPTDASIGSYTFVAGGSGGTITLSVSLSPVDWSGICGNFGITNLPAFDQAIANVKYVGLSFGSGSFFANGLGVDGTTGTATFQLLSYTVS